MAAISVALFDLLKSGDHVVCNNTSSSPYVMRPQEWGVDLVGLS
jgi:cystathionine beta-lyase/cystathionine gamma-synthase